MTWKKSVVMRRTSKTGNSITGLDSTMAATIRGSEAVTRTLDELANGGPSSKALSVPWTVV